MTLAKHLARPVESWRLALIAGHLSSVRRHAVTMQRRHPGHDVEPSACNALYLAALTYKPGGLSFHTWLRWRMVGVESDIRRMDFRRAHPKSVGCKGGKPLTAVMVRRVSMIECESRTSYVDPEPEEGSR